MSWLEERTIQYLYRCEDGDEIILEFQATEDAPDTYDNPGTIDTPDRTYKRINMLPYKVNWTFKIQFERNGLVAYKYDQGNGAKPRIVSATRENYEHNMGNTSGAKLRELKAKGQMNRTAPSITTKGYRETFKRVQAKKGAK